MKAQHAMTIKNKKPLLISLVAFAIFMGLMLFGLKQNANFTPSALVGKPVPEFDANLFPIGKFNSSTIGKNHTWTVVNFWASTCYVCRQEANELEQFYQQVSLANQDAPQFVSVNIQEDFATVADWQRTYSQTFPVILDADGHISILFGVTGTPETFLIDRDGIVRYRIAGAVSTNFILHFIQWFEQNPNASEHDARKNFIEST